jgi:hypothetical protein
MIKLKKCNIKNWDGSTITPLIQIKDRIRVKLQYLELINLELSNKTINYRFHDEPSRIINDLIRWCHGSMGMYSQTKTGCFYIEQGIFGENSVVEHTVTVSDLVKLYLNKNINLGLLLFLPVTLLSKESNELLHKNSKKNEDICYPFRRYFNVGINNITTHNKDLIDLNNYHIRDHFNLVKDTISIASSSYNLELMEIFNYFKVGDSLEEFIISIND